VLSAPLPPGTQEYSSVTPEVPAAHWAERAIGDLFGLRATGHPRWESLLLHEAWPADHYPLRSDAPEETKPAPREAYQFLRVEGEGVHQIPVGPIHAGIIEPGHFRFSCLGGVIANLEIRLGYQHRGIEKRMTEVPWAQGRFLAESASSDTAVGNALAHSVAIEQLLGAEPAPRVQALRTIALELERVACHLGDLGGLSGDIGFSPGAALFSRLRGAALGLGEKLTGSRLQRGYARPLGVSRDLGDATRMALREGTEELARKVGQALPMLLGNPGVVERMEGAGRLSANLAKEFGLVGPAARASGGHYDARRCFAHGVYPDPELTPATRTGGDAYARAEVRGDEVTASLTRVAGLLDSLPVGKVQTALPERLPAGRVAVGVVEAWRGELIHWVTTDGEGRISRYCIKDPSFNNWTGLAIAARGNLVADFPLCNKSFSLSYSGNDL
jgi:Ni,Fe-hydrogenase III large subunit